MELYSIKYNVNFNLKNMQKINLKRQKVKVVRENAGWKGMGDDMSILHLDKTIILTEVNDTKIEL